MSKVKEEKLEVIAGSGNIWQDLSYPDADIRQAKGRLAAQIIGILEDRKLSVRNAAKPRALRRQISRACAMPIMAGSL